jgi:hypothetical protein
MFTKIVLLSCILYVSFFIVSYAQSRGAGECAGLCNDLRFEVLTLEICRNAKKTLPRPKVGDFCSNAMEQGFSDACVPLCMGEKPKNRVAQACRAASMEMPRPTVRKWCEHGYNEGYGKTNRELRSHFPKDVVPEPVAVVEERKLEEEATEAEPEEVKGEDRVIAATIPVTLEDESTHDLIVYEGQNAEEAVVIFCREKVPDDVSSCIRQLVGVVLETLEK